MKKKTNRDGAVRIGLDQEVARLAAEVVELRDRLDVAMATASHTEGLWDLVRGVRQAQDWYERLLGHVVVAGLRSPQKTAKAGQRMLRAIVKHHYHGKPTQRGVITASRRRG